MRGIDRIGSGLKDLSKRLWRARDGGVAMMFALAMPPMTMMAVCGLDLHRASSVRQSLQDALDAATLAAARSGETTDAGIRAVGLRVLRANLAQFPYVTLNEQVNSTNFDLNADGSVTSYARVSVDTLVAGAFLGDELDVNVDSMVFRSNYRLEVALVIDNTGSMAQYGRIEAARTAADRLVRRLADAAERSVEQEAVRISLVPFSMTVRVGSQYQNASWIDNSATAHGNTGATGIFDRNTQRLAMFTRMGIDWGGCVESRPYPYDTLDTAPRASDPGTRFVPYLAPDTPDRADYPGDTEWWGEYWSRGRRYESGYSFDNDYVNDWQAAEDDDFAFDNEDDREEAWFARLKDPRRYRANRIHDTGDIGSGPNDVGPNKGCDMVPLVRLTEDYDDVLDAIADMHPNGNTNIPMGLMWGWHTLSPRTPFADGRPYDEERLQKIIILLTDGDNVNSDYNNPNRSTYSGAGLIWQLRLGASIGATSSATARRNAMDDRLEELCENLRTNEIMLYTVGVQVDSRTQDILSDCATEDDMFFNVSNTAGIESAFDRIAGSIENLRIAR